MQNNKNTENMIEEKKVYNAKFREVRLEIYINGEFYTDRRLAYNVDNKENLPLQ